MLDLGALDLEAIGEALAQQDTFDLCWLLDPRTGEVVLWTSDSGIDDESVELDELDYLVAIDPLPSHVWFQDMADFTDGITDERIARRLARALEGRKPFRRFKDGLYGSDGDLIQLWHTYRDLRAQRRAVEWLLDQGLIHETAAQAFAAEHPDPPLP